LRPAEGELQNLDRSEPGAVRGEHTGSDTMSPCPTRNSPRRTRAVPAACGPRGRPALPIRARVVVLAGPWGVGKPRLAAHTGVPVLRLDDFYRSGDDRALPRIPPAANTGLVDWDDPRSWHHDEAVRAICDLATTGETVAPLYDIARN